MCVPVSFRKYLVAISTAAAFVLSGCSGAPVQPASPSLSDAQIAQIISAPDRSAADRTNDLRRKPAPMLAFIGVRAGMVALDLSTGGGYTSELLARAVGPTGVVYGQGAPRNPAVQAPAAPEGNSNPASNPTVPNTATAPANAVTPQTPARGPRPANVVMSEREEKLRLANVSAAPLMGVVQAFETPVPANLSPGSVDLVTLMFNYHDLGHMGVDRAAMNRAVFRALKPGGIYVIADHAGRPGTGISEAGTLHRIEEDFLKKEVEAAGFRWEASADFLRNPNDPRDRKTPNPPQPKDEFVLKFVRP